MKKKLFFIVSAIALAISVSAFVYVKNESDTMNQFFDANVEALAQNEGSGTLKGYCDEGPDYDCMAQCPGCKALIYAPGHSGPAHDVTGLCANCLKKK